MKSVWKKFNCSVIVKPSVAYQSSGIFNLLDNAIVAKVLQGQPERQGSQLFHWMAGGQTCCQRLRQEAVREKETETTMKLVSIHQKGCTIIKISYFNNRNHLDVVLYQYAHWAIFRVRCLHISQG